jgi:DNA repair exonuclease SbcCD nuclease subunit
VSFTQDIDYSNKDNNEKTKRTIMIKLVHTADLHFGLGFNRYPTVAEQLREERLKALKALVHHGNNEAAHGFVVAGDLFDSRTVSLSLVKEVKSALSAFHGDVFVIPGNHDWYNESANENKLWKWFQDAPGANVHFLNQWTKYIVTLNHQEVTFYACGCHQKHSDENLLGWVQEVEKSNTCVNIGIAHGNVEGFGLDDEGRYFNMTAHELSEAGLDCWLLGHIHAPHPSSDLAGHEPFFFAGNHCPESWKAERPGGAWLIEIDNDKKIKGTRWNHEGICFRDREYAVYHPDDVNHLIGELEDMDASQTVLRLSVFGTLTEEEREEAKEKVEEVLSSFFYKEIDWQVGLKITAEVINKLYVDGSVPHILLNNLSQVDDNLAMQLAYQTIKTLA